MDGRIARLARDQCGVFARAQVRSLGGSDDVIRHRVRSGRWERLRPGVYRLGGVPDSFRQRAWLAHLAAGPASTVSHQSAARLWGLEGYPSAELTVTVPHGQHPRLAGVRAHQSVDLGEHHIVRQRGLPVTSLCRTIVDLAAVSSRPRLAAAIDGAVVNRRLRLVELERTFGELARPGKRGLGVMGSLLDERGPGAVVPNSELERLLFDALAEAGLPDPCRQFPHPAPASGDARVDAAYPDACMILEADGRPWHTRLADLVRDRWRDNQAARCGWQTLRFGAPELADDPGDVAAVVADTRALRLGQDTRRTA